MYKKLTYKKKNWSLSCFMRMFYSNSNNSAKSKSWVWKYPSLFIADPVRFYLRETKLVIKKRETIPSITNYPLSSTMLVATLLYSSLLRTISKHTGKKICIIFHIILLLFCNILGYYLFMCWEQDRKTNCCCLNHIRFFFSYLFISNMKEIHFGEKLSLLDTLSKMQSKFPGYNMKYRGKRETTWNIPRSISFSPPHFMLYSIAENRLPSGQCMRIRNIGLHLDVSTLITLSFFYSEPLHPILCFKVPICTQSTLQRSK